MLRVMFMFGFGSVGGVIGELLVFRSQKTRGSALYLAFMLRARCSGRRDWWNIEAPSGGRRRLRARRSLRSAATLFVRSVPRLFCPRRRVSEATAALPRRRACIDKVGRGHVPEIGDPKSQH